MTEVAVPMSFEEKVKQRVRDSIGDLMSDEDLKRLLERGVEEAFFTERTVKVGSYGDTKREPLMQQMVNDNLKQRMAEAVNAWIKENPDRVEACIRAVLEDKSRELIIQALAHKFTWPLQQAMNQMIDNIRRA